MPLFDAYVMVDWSSSKTPRSGADSIWYAEYRRDAGRLTRRALANPKTRGQASTEIADLLAQLAGDGRRILVGFDFPFGYPAGTAHALGLSGSPWAGMWKLLADGIDDDDETNANNRFELAGTLNRRLSGADFPFWGRPAHTPFSGISARKPRAHRPGEPAERRLCEREVKRAQPVWKLAYNGSVGSQVLMGIPRVRQIRHDRRLADLARIWPFETGLRDDPKARIVLAEMYPSLFDADVLAGMPRDAGQVTAAARGFGEIDSQGRLGRLLAGDPEMDGEARSTVESEEAWILGVLKGPAL